MPGTSTRLSLAIRLAIGLAATAPAAAQARVVPLDTIGAGTPGFRIEGIAAGDQSGYSAAGAGDVNGDGLGDVIIGAWEADPGGRSNAGACYVVFGRADQAPVDLGNLGSSGFRIEGINAVDLTGFPVAGAGDVNGDGLDDVIVGAFASDPGGAGNAGSAFVVFGKADTDTVDLAALGDGGFRMDGVAAGDYSGRGVAGAGDVNGDGLDDLLVGANGAGDGGPFGFAPGVAYVVFGKADGDTVDLGALGAGGFPITTGGAQDELGFEVDGAGDVNGDGLADVLVGAIRADPYGRNDAGAAYVVFGKNDSTPVSVDALGAAGFAIIGATGADLLGRVGAGGDVNGDGLDDLIVGAPFADPGGRTDAGSAYVVFGKSDANTVDTGSLGSAGFRIDGRSGLTGWAVDVAGDFNGDGLDELLVGALNAAPGGRNVAGEVFLIFGRSSVDPIELATLGTAGIRFEGIDSGDRAGIDVSDAGDVDADGFDDIIIGARGADPGGAVEAGESYVVFGSPIALDIDVPPPAGLAAGDRLGSAVATDGNLVAVGLPGSDVSGSEAGRVVVYRIEGRSLIQDAVIDVPTGFFAKGFGAALALQGSRLVVGAPETVPAIPKGPGLLALQAAIFERVSGNDWRLKATLLPSNGEAGDEFGASVALDGDTIVVGAPGDAESVSSGAAYVFDFAGQTTVPPVAKIKPAGGTPGARFGQSVATSAGRIAVGAPQSTVGAAVTGAVHLYGIIAGNLANPVAQGAMAGSESRAGDGFGTSVALTGTTLIVGAPGENDGGLDRGAAYVFDPASMLERRRLTPGQAADGTRFGAAVAVSAAELVAGSPGLNGGAGGIYTFNAASFAHGEVSTAGIGQLGLGAAVAASPETIAAGAPQSNGAAGTARVLRSPTIILRSGFE